MFTITEKGLKKLGFTPKYLPTEGNKRVKDQFEYEKDSILVGRCREEFYIYISSDITSDYYTTVKGVNNETDLISLCNLVDGNKYINNESSDILFKDNDQYENNCDSKGNIGCTYIFDNNCKQCKIY